jgi:glyoxylase-like metal-dependent hydrolase (beta-lactamase superfamily II)
MQLHSSSIISRRSFLRTLGTAGAAAAVLPSTLVRNRYTWLGDDRAPLGPVQVIRRAAETDPIRVQWLRGNISVLSGSGGNIAALPGRDGVLLVDSGIVGAKVAAAVATFSDRPIVHVINSHWHFDHTDANEWLHAHGASILSHETTRAHLARATRVDDWDFTFPASPAGALPSKTFRDDYSVTINDAPIELKLFAPAHTDCDIAAHFTNADVLHVGDTWWNGIYPFIDYSTRGSIDGMIRATERNLATASATTAIIPGHGAVGNRAALARWLDMLGTIRERVAVLKRQGRTSAEVVASNPTKRFDAEYGKGIIGPAFFTRLVYRGT